MKLEEKISSLREKQGLNQDSLAEKMHVSVKEISDWETGAVRPSKEQLIQLSKILNVSSEELLSKEETAQAKEKAQKEATKRTIFIFMSAFNIMLFILQIVFSFFLQRESFSLIVTGLSVVVIAFFELLNHMNHETGYRRFFYTESVWLDVYFPVRILVHHVIHSSVLFNIMAIVIYLAVSIFATSLIRKKAK